MIFLKIRCRQVESASYPVRDLTDLELVCRRIVLLPLIHAAIVTRV